MLTRYLAVVLVAVACLPFCAGGLAASKPKKSALSNKLTHIKGQITVVEKKIRQKLDQKRNVLGQLSATEEQLETTQTKLNANKIKLDDARFDLAQTNMRLKRTEKQLRRREQLLTCRVIDIYKGNDIGYLNVVLGSTDMWSFLTRAYYLKRIVHTDATLISGIKTDKKQIEQDKARQSVRVVQVASFRGELIAQRDEVSSLAQDRRDQLTEIEHSKDLYQKSLDELLAESRAIENEIRKFQNTQVGRRLFARSFHGGLMLPISGRISSRFGYRMHPITHIHALHTGVDLPAHTGTPIHAAADGVVTIAARRGGYGLHIVIQHDGGVSTLYGHCSRLMVSVGQAIRRGQVIALVGSTGNSTGPHCHFEKRINGSPVNPL